MRKNKETEPAVKYSEIPLFAGIKEEDLNALLFCLHNFVQTYDKGEYIVLEQDHVNYAGIVLSGSVHMLKEDIWGNQTLLSYMNPGEMFGESFSVRKEKESFVSFVAAKKTEVLFVATHNMIHSCAKQCVFHQTLTQNLFDLMGKKSLRLMERIEISSKNTLREKILAYLSLQSQQQGGKYIKLPLKREEMAKFLQSNRSALSRELSQMRADGLIDFEKETFVLKI